MNIPMMALTATVIRNTLLATEGFCDVDADDGVDADDDVDGNNDDKAQHIPACRITLDVAMYKEALSRTSV